jgi:hypothetical protein
MPLNAFIENSRKTIYLARRIWKVVIELTWKSAAASHLRFSYLLMQVGFSKNTEGTKLKCYTLIVGQHVRSLFKAHESVMDCDGLNIENARFDFFIENTFSKLL